LGGIEDLGKLFRQAFDKPLQSLHVGQPLAFRPFVKTLVLGLGLLLVQRFDEQVGPLDHPFALYAIGSLVMLEPSQQSAGRERLLADRSEQGTGIGLVGARQRQQNPVGDPTGDLAGAHGIGKGLGQLVDQGQAAAYPALVLTQGRCDRLLREPLVHQARQQPRLFDRLQRARLMLPDDPQHRIIEAPFREPGQGPVLTQLAEGLYPPIAIDQHQPITAFYNQDRLTLPVGLEGESEPANTRRIDDARRLETPVQAVQIDFYGGATVVAHARHPNPDPPPRAMKSSLCNHALLASIGLITKRFPGMTRPSLQSDPIQGTTR